MGTGRILELSRTHGTYAYPWLVAGDVVTLSVAQLGDIVAPWCRLTSADERCADPDRER